MRRIRSEQNRIAGCRLAFVVFLFASVLLNILSGGCSAVYRARRAAYEAELSAPYNQIVVRRSIIQDAVPKIQRLKEEYSQHLAASELISHSDNVVVSLGQSGDGFRTWFNMVAFRQGELDVIRKYFFYVNDKTRPFQLKASRGLRFDCEMALAKEVLDQLHNAENARRIVILRNVLDNFQKDLEEISSNTKAVGQENQMLNICRLLINQTFDAVLHELDNSPVLAARLSQLNGLGFDHMSFDKGQIQMLTGVDAVRVKIRLGAFINREEVVQPQGAKKSKRARHKPSSVMLRRY